MRTSTEFTDLSREIDEQPWWDLWNTSYRSEDGRDAISSELFARVSAVVNEIAANRVCHVLEIGCGTGTLSRLLRYTSYHGLDISPAAIAIAKRKAGDDSTSSAAYEAADFHDWPLPDSPCEVALCVDAISYFRDPQAALTKMARSLRACGQLVLTTINPFVYSRIRRTATQPLAEGPVSHWFTRRELHAAIRGAGFSIERSYTIMPRGNCGILRVINSHRLNHVFGLYGATTLRRLKEIAGLGQYRLVIARKL